MKKILFITGVVILAILAMTTGVKATEVNSWDELKVALTGTDETVKLTQDITGVAEKITISNNKSLDLNGKTLTLSKSLAVEGSNLTITGNGKITTSSADPLIDVRAGSNLELENGIFESTTYYGATIQVIGTATDDGIKTKIIVGKNAELSGNYVTFIPKNGYGVEIDVYGNLKGINGNNGWTYGSIGLYVNGTIKATTGNVPIINIYDGANIEAKDGPAIYGAGYAIWNIKGGTFEGTEAVSIKSGKFNITGGTFKANGEYVDPITANGNGTEPSGSAISITTNTGYAGNIEISISNATVTSQNGYALLEAISKGTDTAVKSMKISSGDFSGKEGSIYSENVEKFIKGGTYNDSIESKYVEDTLTSVEDNGAFYVGTLNEIVVIETPNGTVKTSLEKAVKGQIVEISFDTETAIKDMKVYCEDGRKIEWFDPVSFYMPDCKVFVEVTFYEKEEEIKEETNNEVNEETENQKTENQEKDETPKTGSLNVALYVSIAIVAIALLGIVTAKRPGKYSK